MKTWVLDTRRKSRGSVLRSLERTEDRSRGRESKVVRKAEGMA